MVVVISVMFGCWLQEGRSALHHAIQQSPPATNVVRRLIRLGADVNVKDHVSWSIFSTGIATAKGDLGMKILSLRLSVRFVQL